ncbi:hypothetical protein [Mucisphaera sp.]|uniref:hypothetical protein n=1 Tax=Mucisphaera sp. TaxID=2913024 RepID=UPI003D115158
MNRWMLTGLVLLLAGFSYAPTSAETVRPETPEIRGADRVYRLNPGKTIIDRAALSPDGRYAAVIDTAYFVDPSVEQHPSALVWPDPLPADNGLIVTSFRWFDLATGKTLGYLPFPPEINPPHGGSRLGGWAGHVDVYSSNDNQSVILEYQSSKYQRALASYSLNTCTITGKWFADENDRNNITGFTRVRRYTHGKYLDVIYHEDKASRIARLSFADLSELASIRLEHVSLDAEFRQRLLRLGPYEPVWRHLLNRRFGGYAYLWDHESDRLKVASNLFADAYEQATPSNLPRPQLVATLKASNAELIDVDLIYLSEDGYPSPILTEDGLYATSSKNASLSPMQPSDLEWGLIVFRMQDGRLHWASDRFDSDFSYTPVDGGVMLLEAPPRESLSRLRRLCLIELEMSEYRSVHHTPPVWSGWGPFPTRDRAFLRYSRDGSRAVNFVDGEIRVYDFEVADAPE